MEARRGCSQLPAFKAAGSGGCSMQPQSSGIARSGTLSWLEHHIRIPQAPHRLPRLRKAALRASPAACGCRFRLAARLLAHNLAIGRSGTSEVSRELPAAKTQFELPAAVLPARGCQQAIQQPTSSRVKPAAAPPLTAALTAAAPAAAGAAAAIGRQAHGAWPRPRREGLIR